MNKQDTHSPLDALLGAAPRRVMRHWLSLLVLALAALGALAFFVRFVSGENSPYYSAPVERGNLVPLVSERGHVRGSGEVSVSATIRGRAIWVTIKNEGEVEKGELLAVLDARQVASAVAIGKSRLAAAEAALQAAEVSAQDIGARLARFESVWRRSGGRAPSLNEMERARAEAHEANLGIEAARAEAETAALQLKEQQTRLDGAEVRAPIAGTLVMREIQPGQTVAENQPLFKIAAGLSPLTIEVPLTSRPGSSIKADMLAKVRVDAVPDTPQSATLTLLRVSSPSGSTPPRAVFTFQNPDPRVRPGMAATVEIDLPERRDVLLVPDAALAFEPVGRPEGPPEEPRARIYVLENGDPRRVYVTVGGSDGKRAEVFANDLKPGDRAIIGWRDATSGSERSGR